MIHPAIASMLHSYIAAMPEAQTVTPAGQEIAPASAAPPAEVSAVGADAGQATAPQSPNDLSGFVPSLQTAQNGLDKAGAAGARDVAEKADAAQQTFKAQEAASAAKTEAENLHDEHVGKIWEEHLPRVQQLDEDLTRAMDEGRAEAARRYDNYIQKTNEFNNTKLYSWWGNASTSAKILGVISQLAAGALNGLTGQPGAKTPLDTIIDRDLEQQRLNLQKKSDEADMARGAYHDVRATLKDDLAVSSSMREIALTSVKTRIDGLIATEKDALKKQRLTAASAELTTRIGQLRSDLSGQLSESAMKSAQLSSNIGIAAANLWGDMYKTNATNKASVVGLSDVVGNTEALSKDNPTVFKDLTDFIPAVKNGGDSLRQLANALEDQELRKLSPADFRNRMNGYVANYETNMNTVAKLGALSLPDAQKLLAQANVPREFGTVSALAHKAGTDPYEAIAKRVRLAADRLDAQARDKVGSIKVNGRPLQLKIGGK